MTRRLSGVIPMKTSRDKMKLGYLYHVIGESTIVEVTEIVGARVWIQGVDTDIDNVFHQSVYVDIESENSDEIQFQEIGSKYSHPEYYL